MPARIYSMSFNSTSTLLSVSSATETVHIFRLGAPNTSRSNSISSGPTNSMSTSHQRSGSRTSEDMTDDFGSSTADVSAAERKPLNPTFASMVRRSSQTVGKSFAATIGGYLPGAVAQIWEPARDFAWVKIPRSPNSASAGPMRTVVALSNNGPQIMVVTSEGNYYVFNVDLEKGGEGTLYKQYSYVNAYAIEDEQMLTCAGYLNRTSLPRAIYRMCPSNTCDSTRISFSILDFGCSLHCVWRLIISTYSPGA